MKNRNRPPVHLARFSSRPEVIQARHSKAFRGGIPKPEMQIYRRRNLGVEKVTAPLPSGLANHRGQMIGWEIRKLGQGLISKRQKGIAGRRKKSLRKVNVDVVLRAQIGMGAEFGAVREPFQQYILDLRTSQMSGDLEQSRAQPMVPLRIAGEICVYPAPDLVRQVERTEEQSQLRAVAKRQRLFPQR